jgi:hypothetical protein
MSASGACSAVSSLLSAATCRWRPGTQGSLVVRVDPEDTDEFLAKPHARPLVMGGRPMKGRVRVDAEGVRTTRQLECWVRLSVAYARSLPPKR